jgi:hypothetical protein
MAIRRAIGCTSPPDPKVEAVASTEGVSFGNVLVLMVHDARKASPSREEKKPVNETKYEPGATESVLPRVCAVSERVTLVPAVVEYTLLYSTPSREV